MEKTLCGECNLAVNDLEPIRCGFCETCFHINQQCCGINSRLCKEFLAQGKIIFICPSCREVLNGRSVCAYVTELQSNQPSQPQPIADLPAQVQKLFDVVDKLSRKIDNMPRTTMIEDPMLGTSSALSTTLVWPIKNAKRRRTEPIHIEADRGKNNIDLSDLSVPSIVPVAAKNRSWLYLSGLNPKVTDGDIQKIISRCLHTTEHVVAVRLVRKGIDTSNLSYVSHKIGLDPDLKNVALDPASWPTGMLFREFVELPKK
ncbi:uncharacterized protein LOC129717096 [Wyeomyia smithii]|uniref:uncharacterized protein LOC129717096 n=1 Tax=Wyeomyia smithii TaxID=174621 RepID=UPI002467E2CE|nr:uncharacterized protein LOC129717096 [Wyeomyia smithii]